jgi:hypothetical protein
MAACLAYIVSHNVHDIGRTKTAYIPEQLKARHQHKLLEGLPTLGTHL